MNKKTTTISMILILTIATIMASIPLTNAQAPRKKTYAFMGLIPDTVGVGQETLLHLGIFTPTANLNYAWEGLTISVTRPDGTTQTLGPFASDATGGTGTSFIPTQVGAYTFQSHFPEQENPVTFFEPERGVLHLAGTIMEASDSEVATLTVTEEPIQHYPAAPLPTEFWSRPIDSQYREWYPIAGNWLETPRNVFAPYNDGPETAHILWAKPISTGGLAGGETGINAFEDGDAYEGKYQDPVIINGVLYYNRYPTPVLGVERSLVPSDGIIAADLRTGEELWVLKDTRLDFGQTLNWDNFNFHGVYDYLWNVQGSTWNAYDPFNGEWLYGMTDVPSGIRYTGANGEFLIVVTDYANGWMALWSQIACGQQDLVTPGDDGSWQRFILGNVYNGSNPKSYLWNVTIPTGLPPGNIGFFGGLPTVVEDRVLGINISPTRDALTLWAISLKPGQEGQLIFNKAWTPPTEWQTGLNTIHYTGATNNGDGGVCVVWNKELRTHYGFSLDTGSYLWETESEHYLQAYGWGAFEHSWFIAYDKLYSTGVSGYLYCYDINTGETVWTYEAKDPYSEFLFSTNWWGRIPFITDGKVYLGHAEHSPLDPKPRGAPFACLDAETGEVIWKVDGMFRQTHWGGRGIIADSIIATMDTYDSRIYAIGKGPSETTIEAPGAGVALGTPIVIKGMVTDISAGTMDPAVAARFPKGVAAVSDESMSDWMLYVYKQSARPMDTVGVPVTIDVIDSNGNFRNVGTATSDSSGFYSLDWTPDIPGAYSVIATFAGSSAYYPSYCMDAFVVDEAPEATPPPEPTPGPQTDTTLLGLNIAAIIAIIVIGLLILLMLRKR
jgi:outer membrane protein assembly factor BamB